MDRNDKRFWYDKGYSLGVAETQRDAIIPRVIGVWVLVTVSFWDPVVSLILVLMLTPFEVLDYRSRRREAKAKRKHHNPGKRWE